MYYTSVSSIQCTVNSTCRVPSGWRPPHRSCCWASGPGRGSGGWQSCWPSQSGTKYWPGGGRPGSGQAVPLSLPLAACWPTTGGRPQARWHLRSLAPAQERLSDQHTEPKAEIQKTLLLIQKHHEIAKGCPENISSVVKCVKLFLLKVLRKYWTVLRKNRERSEKELRKNWKSIEKVPRKYRESTEKVLKKYWESTVKVPNNILKKYWKGKEKSLKNYWESTEKWRRFSLTLSPLSSPLHFKYFSSLYLFS